MRLPRPPGRRRLRRSALAVVGVALLAACVPLPPEDSAPPASPPSPPPPLPTFECIDDLSSADAYNTLFNLRSTEWAAADITNPVGSLFNGQYLWLFGDTFWGKVQPSGELGDPSGFNNNSFASQQVGNCLHYRMGGSEGNRTNVISDPGPLLQYWPVSGYVDPVDPSLVRVFLLKIQLTDDNHNGIFGEDFEFYIANTHVATLSSTDQHVVALEAVTGSEVDSARPGYGDGFAAHDADGDHVVDDLYLYGFFNSDTDPALDGNYVAKASAANPTAAWEFWDGTAWSTDPADARPVVIDDPSDLVAQLHPVKWGTGSNAWLAVAEEDFWDLDVHGWTAPDPQGPWTRVPGAPLVTIPTPPPGGFTYGARFVDLPGVTGPTVAWNLSNSVAAIEANVRLYGPRFKAPDFLPPT